jgi:hypothetical protein
MPLYTLVAVVLAAILVAGLVWRLAGAWWRYRGQRVVTCPETQRPAGVVLDARHAASAFSKGPQLRLSECTRWPEKAGCGQECLSEVRDLGADCLVRNIIAKWYRDKECAKCGRPIGEIDWSGSRPAVLAADGDTFEWPRISADKLIETLAASLPICFACHTANRMVKEHPELVTDRHRAGV